MKNIFVISSIAVLQIVWASAVLGQGFGEYGRAVGSIPYGGKGVTGSGPSVGRQGNAGVAGVGELGGRALPARLVVIAKTAGLFPRQDDESEKISQLIEGENLAPMVQSEGTNAWYMVRTEKGLVGWVKSADVRQEKPKK